MGTPNAGDEADKAAISVVMAANFQAHFVYLLARAFFAPRMPVTFALISVLASGRDFRTHSALAIYGAAPVGGRNCP
jgi:hypothetical protein